MDEQAKAIYLELIDRANTPEEFKVIFKDFLNSYDGSNVTEFKEFLSHFFILLSALDIHMVKAEAYEKIMADHKDLNEYLEDLVSDFKAATDPSKPLAPADGGDDSAN